MIVETSHRFKFRAKCIEGKGYLLIDSIQRLSRSIRVFPGTRQPLNAEKNSTKLQTPIPPNQCSTNAARITAPLTHSRLPGSRWCARLTLDSARHPDPDPERQQYREITGTRNSADRAQNLAVMQQPGIHSLGALFIFPGSSDEDHFAGRAQGGRQAGNKSRIFLSRQTQGKRPSSLGRRPRFHRFVQVLVHFCFAYVRWSCFRESLRLKT